MALVDGKLLLTDELTFDIVEDALLQLGYSWHMPGKIRRSDLPDDVNMIFFSRHGVLRFAADKPDNPFWLKHPNPQYTILDGQLYRVIKDAVGK